MNNIYDRFYEVLHKNKQRRRKMFSLLLVLSLFTSTGVVWALRDVGITMVNEDLVTESVLTCGLEEHTHDDECYSEGELICSRSEHVHSDDCYTTLVLLCDDTEHQHTEDCYAVPQYVGEPVMVANEGVEILADSSHQARPVSDGQAQEFDHIVSDKKVDNIARGIKISMFDYRIVNQKTEGEGDSATYSWTSVEGDPYDNKTTPQTTYQGINSDFWAGKEDLGIYFFPYSSNNTDAAGNYCVDGNANKNYYSGDYREGHEQSGNRAVQGIVKNTLEPANNYNNNIDGGYGNDTTKYPVVQNGSKEISLAYLFNNTPLSVKYENGYAEASRYKWVYEYTNYLLHEENGHLRYSSNENYAQFAALRPKSIRDGTNEPVSESYSKEYPEVYNFDVKDKTFRLINGDHHVDGDKDLKENTYDETEKEDFMIGFFPFDEYNNTKLDPNWNATKDNENSAIYNHHFGMKMETQFRLPENNTGDPITFSYSGDDDMWVFIDDHLVLDIGGIHEPCAGMIDFTNGLVWVQDNAEKPANDQAHKGEALAQEVSRLVGKTVTVDDLENGSFPRPEFGYLTQGGENKWVVKKITEFILDWDSIATSQSHKLDMFYLERGGCYSNLSVDMNLPTVGTLTVGKKLQSEYTPDEASKLLDQTYKFELWELGTDNTDDRKIGEVSLPPNKTYTFTGLQADSSHKYKIIEKDVKSKTFKKTIVNGTEIKWDSGFITANPEQSNIDLEQNSVYTFTNVVEEDDTSGLKVTKIWDDNNNQNRPKVLYFKVYRTIYQYDDNGTLSTYKRRHLMAIDGTFTQQITPPTNNVSANTWETTLKLPKRYGEYVYEYDIEEILPDGYQLTERTTDEKGNTTLKNQIKGSTNTIKAQKIWVNTPSDQSNQTVTLKLVRKVASKKSAADRAQVTVNILNKNGEVIKSEIISDTPQGPAYVGGSIEFNIDIDGTPVEDEGGINCNGASCYHVGNVFELSNIQSDTTISIKYDTDAVAVGGSSSPEYIIYDNFEDGKTSGWEAIASYKGDVGVIEDNNNHSLKVTKDSSKNWDGAQKKVSSPEISPGIKYSVVAYVFCEDPNAEFQLSAKYTPSGYPEKYDAIPNDTRSCEKIPNTLWRELKGTVTFPTTADPDSMYIYVENPAIVGGGTYPKVFKIDNFAVAEGEVDLAVSQQGKVTIDGQPAVLKQIIRYHNRFESASDLAGWTVNGETPPANDPYRDIFTTGNGKYSGNDGAGARNINGVQYRGAQMNLGGLGLSTKKDYTFAVYVKPANPTSQKIAFAIDDGSKGHDWGGANAISDWTRLTFTVNANTIDNWSDHYIKIQAQESGYTQFYFDDLIIVEGKVDVSIEQGSGNITLGKPIYDVDFKKLSSSNTDGWGRYDDGKTSVQLNVDSQYGNHLRIKKDAENPDVLSAARNATKLESGKKYRISARILKINNGNSAASNADLWLSCGNNRFDQIGTGTVSDTFNCTWEFTSDATDGIIPYLKFSDVNSEYAMENFKIEELTTIAPSSTSIIHTTSTTVKITPIPHSITKPASSEYNTPTLEENWFRTGTIIGDGSVTWNDINEVSGNYYEYYVIETKINNVDSPHLNDAGVPVNGNPYAFGEDYIIVYENEGATNGTITVRNTYKWYTLPATGGMGVHKVYIAGGGLIIAGIYGLIKLRKRERRHE